MCCSFCSRPRRVRQVGCPTIGLVVSRVALQPIREVATRRSGLQFTLRGVPGQACSSGAASTSVPVVTGTPWPKVLAPAVITAAMALAVSYLATDGWARQPNLCEGVYADPQGSALGPDPNTELGLCDQGAEVGDLQASLAKLGYDIKVTNAFDRQTRAAVIAFQRRHERDNYRLAVDGLVGPQTRQAMADDLARGPSAGG